MRPGRKTTEVATKREIVGGLGSAVLHAGLLAWVVGHPPPGPSTIAPEPDPVEIELVELTPPTPEPLALKSDGGRAGQSRIEREAPEAVEPEPRRDRPERKRDRDRDRAEPEPPKQPRPEPTLPQVPTQPDEDDGAEAEPEPPAPATAADGEGTEPSSGVADDAPARTSPRRRPGEGRGSGNREGRGSGLGTDGMADHSAYGAELVRLVKAEIDKSPVPGLGPRDSIEVELKVLPSGRLARFGLGRYDSVRVVHSTLGPLRMRAILRRIIRASEQFPPHPSGFPRQRYLLGFTVRFRDFTG